MKLGGNVTEKILQSLEPYKSNRSILIHSIDALFWSFLLYTPHFNRDIKWCSMKQKIETGIGSIPRKSMGDLLSKLFFSSFAMSIWNVGFTFWILSILGRAFRSSRCYFQG